MRSSVFVLVFLVVILGAGLGGGALWARHTLAEKDRLVDYLLADVERLRQSSSRLAEENSQLARDLETLRADLASEKQARAAQQTTIEESMVPREIGSKADFPVERGMARPGESVSDFAKREKTSVSVLKALNPWLDEAKPLQHYQTLWLPIRR
ncbi:hypothetical protein F11_08920 [Rhodospirillum rubrum F11]|uniref:LysM domain-containing protein n=3 Tax=Rhodospirillum rubrum TaxID=1085 RepID=Q2RTL3_RHORT|nr:LysM domain-containing protein [Rhodospirillum rubrum]ABC22532.1 hypothetical protein Rru_A1732 [Rhodospirillum rubrum ATCC 11170]AEO48250.1 hypothetical protein F11_08920 [Rhodospirillum rubrum F11]MBK5954120.1 hypothetical protein [Rhodospirillum rubrum]QXG82160.1 LysM domain-containing protein [Rhodospirillum rubrum]